jgi:GNAT superfamily N-acetyltransferase
MIRVRREDDLDRLCDVLRTLSRSAGLSPGQDPRAWLEDRDAELSWVFDMAPVRVTPTRNVVGHVQIYRATGDLASDLVSRTGTPARDLLVIGKLFVRAHTHEQGIGRFLLKESIRYVTGHGKLPVLNVADNAFVGQGLYERLGFANILPAGPGAGLMVHSR